MSIFQRMAALLRPAPAPRSHAVPTAPVTPLAASVPFKATSLPPSSPPHPDRELVLARWGIYRSVLPQASFEQFLRHLRHDLAFHQRERVEREARLADLQRTPRFTP